MKYSMLFIFAALITMTVSVFNVSSASATIDYLVLCKLSELVCEHPWPHPVGARFLGKNTKLLSSIGTVECEETEAEVEFQNLLSITIIGIWKKILLLGKCNLGGTSCTVAVNELGSLEFTHTGSSTAIALSNGKTKISYKCGSFINCTYGGKFELVGQSSEEGVFQLFAKEATLGEGKGFLCPATSKWDATFTAVGMVIYLRA